jgi:O-antigen/teichoic acid export membrane protein
MVRIRAIVFIPRVSILIGTMAARIRNFATGVIFWSYRKVFGKEAGPATRNFIKNMVYIFIGLFIAKVLSMVFQIYVGRMIGATEYGKYALLNSFMHFLYVPMIIGLDSAIVKYLAPETTVRGRTAVISTSVIIIAIFTVATIAFVLCIPAQIGMLAGVDGIYIIASLVLAFFYTVWVISQKILQGLDMMKSISVINIIYGLSAFLSGVVFLLYWKTAFVPAASLCVGYALSSLVVFPQLRKYLRPVFDVKIAKKMLSYGAIAAIAIFAGSLSTNINQIFLNMFLDVKTVGVYQAYNFATFGFVTFLVTIVLTVFFPESSRQKDKSMVFSQLRHVSKYAPLLFVVFFPASVAIIMLYGSGYPLMLDLIALFSLSSIMVFLYSVYNVYAASCGIGGIRKVAYSMIIISALGTASAYALIPVYGLYGAAGSTMISYLGGFVAMYLMSRSLARESGGK